MTAAPRISVALATYNGERFLAEQLESLARQTCAPCELVVCDDGSSDCTRGLLEAFVARAPFPVRVLASQRRQGSTATFERAIRACSGDVIALCDQDDTWRPEKLAQLAAAFAGEPSPGLVFSNAELIDAAGRPLADDLWQAVSFSRREQDEFRAGRAAQVLLRRYAVTGATLAFRAAEREWLLPVPHGWIHDAWLALLLVATGPVALIEEKLIQYRQHAGQQIGARRRTLREQLQRAAASRPDDFLRQAYNFEAVHRRLTENASRLLNPEILSQLQEKAAHCRTRARLRFDEGLRLPHVWREFTSGRYRRFARGWQSALHDLLL